MIEFVKEGREMDERIMGVIDVLTDYDQVLSAAVDLADRMEDDPVLSVDSMSLMEGVLISIMLDKAAPYIPDDMEKQEEVIGQADRIDEVLGKIPVPTPLLYQVALGYAVALSQGRNGWRPWEQVRDCILEWEDEQEDTSAGSTQRS